MPHLSLTVGPLDIRTQMTGGVSNVLFNEFKCLSQVSFLFLVSQFYSNLLVSSYGKFL